MFPGIARTIVILLLCLPVLLLKAQPTYPDPTDNYVNDFAGILEPDIEGYLRQHLTALETDDGIEMTVVTISSLADYGSESLRDYTTGLFNTWGVGDAEADNGILMLVSVGDRRLRIEVGSGYEGELNEAVSIIIDENILPSFRRDDYNGGVYNGVLSLIGEVTGERPADLRPDIGSTNASAGGGSAAPVDPSLILIGAGGLALVGGLFFLRRGRGGGGRGRGSMRCPQCRRAMLPVLDEAEADKLLTREQRTEQKAHDVRYSVWACDKGHTWIETPSAIKHAKGCPECHAKTYVKGGSKTVAEATEEVPGRREYYEYCRSCGYRNVRVETIERLKTQAEKDEDSRRSRERAEQKRRQQRQRQRQGVRASSMDDYDDPGSRSSSGGGSSSSGGDSDFGGGSSDGDGDDGDW